MAKVNSLAASITSAQELREQCIAATMALGDSIFSSILARLAAPLEAMPSVAEINPPRRSTLLSTMDKPITFVPMSAVDDVTGTILRPQIRQMQDVIKGYTVFQSEDVIFARITPCMQNGKCAIARNLMNGVGFGSTEFHVVRPSARVTPEWLHLLMRHFDFRSDAAKHFKGTAGQQRVPEGFLSNKQIPVPPISEQNRIVAQMSTLHSRLDAMRHLQQSTAAELDALLPSVLDRAFRGEL